MENNDKLNRIMDAIKDLLPEEDVDKVMNAIEDALDSHSEELEGEFNDKLGEAYEKLSRELEEAEIVAEQGYAEAYEMIQELNLRLEKQRKEFEAAQEEGYAEAYEMLKAERAKNEQLEVELYKDYEGKLNEMREWFIDKIDQFMEANQEEFYTKVRREVMNDPAIFEHKLAIEKVAQVVGEYLDADDFDGLASQKLDETTKMLDQLKTQLKVLESKNSRLSLQNNKLNESLNEAKNLIVESRKVERKERTERTANASGRGKKVMREDLITEDVNVKEPASRIDESAEFSDWLTLAGVDG